MRPHAQHTAWKFGRIAVIATLAFVLCAPSACKKPNVSLDIVLPSDVVEDTVWFEVAAYKGASCEAVKPMLQNGVPPTASTRVAFRRVPSTPAETAPAFGDIDRGSYAFAAVARGDDCRVLATGCEDIDLGDSDSVVIPMVATETPLGACGTDSICEAARCVPPIDNKDPSVGAGCSLEILGAGPLPTSGEASAISAPAIGVTPRGFVIGYREISGASSYITLQPVDQAGGALDPTRKKLKDNCNASADRSDGIGLLIKDTDGQIVLSSCDDSPALDLLTFKAKKADDESDTVEITIGPTAVSTPAPASVKAVTLAGGHVAAHGASGDIVVFTQDGTNRVSTIVPGSGIVEPTGTFGGTANMTGAWVAASDKVLALLSSGPPSEGGEGTELGLLMVPANTPLPNFIAAENKPRRPVPIPGTWGAVAASGSHVIVLSDRGTSASYNAFDLASSTSESGRVQFRGESAPTAGDAVIVEDRVYFGVLGPGSVSLHVFGNASTKPLLLHEVGLDQEPRTSLAVAQVRNSGRVAVAATSSRVAIAWTTASTLESHNEATGGYAIFACTQ